MLNLSKLAYWCFLTLVFLVPLIGGQFDFATSAPLYILALLSVLLFLVSRSPGFGPLWIGSAENVSLALLLFLSVVSLAFSVGINASLIHIYALASFFAVFLLASSVAWSGKAWVPPVVLAVAAIWLGMAAIQEYQSYHAEYMKMAGSEYRAFGRFITPGFFNPGFLAGFLAMTLPVTLGLYCASEKKWLTVTTVVSFLAQLSGLLLTGTRFGALAALLGFGVFVLLLVVAKSLSRTVILRLAVVVALSLIPLALFHAPMTFRVAAAQAESHSLAFRALTWQASLNMIADRPLLGFGPGTFHLAFPRFAIAGYTRMAHSSFLQIGSEVGAPALAALLTALAAALATAFRGLRLKVQSPQSPVVETTLLCGLIAGAAASIARNLTDSDWYVPGIGLSFWLILGLAVGLSRRTSQLNSAAAGLRKPVVAAVMVVILVLLGAVAITDIASVHAEKARTSYLEEDYASAVQSWRSATLFSPLSAQYHRELARSLVGAFGEEGMEQAEAEARRAAELEPTHAVHYMLLADLQHAQGEREEALALYRQAESVDPNSPSIKIAIADSLQELGKPTEAISVYQEIIRIENTPYEKIAAIPELVDPNYAYAHYALGRLYQDQGNRRQAIDEFESVIERIVRRNRYEYMIHAQRLAAGDPGDDERIQAVYEDSKRRLRSLASR